MQRQDLEENIMNLKLSAANRLAIALTVGVVVWAIHGLIAEPLTGSFVLQMIITLPLSFLLISIIGAYFFTRRLSSVVKDFTKATSESSEAGGPGSGSRARRTVKSTSKNIKKRPSKKDNK